MKRLFPAIIAVIFLAGFTTCAVHSSAQTSSDKKEAKAKNKQAVTIAVSNKHYNISVNSATGQRGRRINLTSPYGIKVSASEVNCDLPYYGQAYSNAGYNSGGGVNFKSTNFEYTSVDGKKGGWNITIKPKDQTDVQEIMLYISPDGYTDISITFNSRSSMRYSGMMVFAEAKE